MSALESLAIEPTVYYTVEEAADLLRVSPHEVLSLVESQRIHGVRIDHHRRILGSALLDLTVSEEASESAHIAEWLAASTSSLKSSPSAGQRERRQD